MSSFSKILDASVSHWLPFKKWNERFDIWSLSADVFFLFGVFVLDWNPVLLIAYFIIDTAAMSVFAIILFYKEKKDWIYTLGFIFCVFVILSSMLALYNNILLYIDELTKLAIPTRSIDHSELFNPIVIPLILCFSALAHHAEYAADLQRMRKGTYKSSYIKHFGLRFILLNGIVVLMVFSYAYYNLTIIVGLLAIKSIVRLVNKKYRKIL